MKRFGASVAVLFFLFAAAGCAKSAGGTGGESSSAGGDGRSGRAREGAAAPVSGGGEGVAVNAGLSSFDDVLRKALQAAEIPPDMARRIMNSRSEEPSFIMDLLSCLNGDPFLRRLVDKKRALPDGYRPEDLVELGGGSYTVGRSGLTLRAAAERSLEEMAAAARREGVNVVVSSAFRSYEYQVEVYSRNVRELGREAADRESSRPGFSQHQTGLAVDFGSITDSFAQTKAGCWIAANAGRFGWSISFPDGYEAVTGYRWESWHYRFVGKELAAFINNWFDGIQQYALQFIHAWEEFSSR